MKQKLLIWIIVSLLLISFASATAQYNPITNVYSAVFSWQFNESSFGTANDDITNLKLINKSGNPSSITGIYGNAINYTANDMHSENNTEIWNSTKWTAFTTCFWIRINNMAPDSIPFSIYGNANNQLWMSLDGVSQNLRVYMKANGGTACDSNLGTTPIVSYVWQHICININNTNITYYLNGTKRGQKECTTGLDDFSITPTLYVGENNIAGSTIVLASFDELLFFNTTLNVSQINSIYLGNTTILTYLDNINLSATQPTTGSTFSTNTISFNGTMNNTYSTNVSLYINSTLNQTIIYGSGINTAISFSKSMNDESYSYYFYAVQGNDTTQNETSATSTFSVDSIALNPTFYPSNMTQYNTSSINFNITVNSSSAPNCSIILNNIITYSEVISSGNNVLFNHSLSLGDGSYNISFYCKNQYDGIENNSAMFHKIYLDNVYPSLITNFINNSLWHIKNNITGSFNFSDDQILSSVNITLDGIQIYGNLSVSQMSLNYSFNSNVSTVSNHTIGLRWADGHTKNAIGDYNILNSDGLTFSFNKPYNDGWVKITSNQQQDKWTTTKQKDRYKFKFSAKSDNETYSFIITSSFKMQIIKADWTEYKKWIVIDDHWLDLFNPDYDIDFKQINDNKIIAYVSNKARLKIKDIEFSSIGDLNIRTSSYIFYTINDSEIYSSPVIETTTNNFKLNISYSGIISNISATLNYNNTQYMVLGTDYGTSYIFSQNILSPSISTDTNISFWWNITINGALQFNTTAKNQSVKDINLDSCLTNTDILINLTMKDEANTSYISPTDMQLDLTINNILTGFTWSYHNSTNETSLAVCLPTGTLNAMALSTFTIDAIAGYKSSNYVQEFWYINNGTVSNISYFNSYTPTHIYLYDLLLISSTTFLFKYTDENGLPVDNAIIHTYRKYIGDGTFKEIERSKQDNNGETHIHLVEEDVIYYFVVSQYGNIKYTSNTYNAKCLSSPCEIDLKGSSYIAFPIDWETIDGTSYNIDSNKTSRITTLSYNSNNSATFNYSVYKYDGNVTLANSSISTGFLGSISLIIPTLYGNATYIGVIYKNNSFVKSEWIDMKLSGKDYFGKTGAILSGFIIMCIGLMSISEGVLLIPLLGIALILIGMLAFTDLAWFTIISIICAGSIIAYLIVKRNR